MKIIKKITFILVVASLLFALVAGFTAFASDAQAPSGISISSDDNAPMIVSKNLTYASYLRIHFAVPASSVEDGYDPIMRFYKSEPTDSSIPYLTVTEYTVEKISSISGKAEDYYVFISSPISAKNIADSLWAVPVAVNGDSELVGEVETYSVAEYCYERLYKNGYIDMTSANGKDYLRRCIYEALLQYGAAAQLVLYPNKPNMTLATELNYFTIRGAGINGMIEPGDKVALPDYDGAEPKGYKFDGWELVNYVNGVAGSSTVYKIGSTVTFSAGASVFTPHFYVYDAILAQEGYDDVMIEQKWAELESVAGADIVAALKTLYSMYTDEIADWSASLYAKGYNDIESGNWAGGYYASTAGRDTEGLGPDVQCTEQMLRFIVSSGMVDHLGGSVNNALPDWMKYQLIYFVKSLQAENGYFYHPQWGQSLTDSHLSRRGRDLGWATSILGRWSIAPEYNTPNGKAGNGQSADEYLKSLIDSGLVSPSDVPESFAKKYLTEAIGASTVSSVSKVVLADVAIEDEVNDNTGHLTSYIGFINYMVSDLIPGMKSNPYSMGNEISSIQNEIKTASAKLGGTAEAPTPYVYTEGDESNTLGATREDYAQFDGMTLKEIVIHALNVSINTEIGLWGEKSEKNPTGTEFLFTNGFMKAMAIYNDYNVTYPYPVAAAKALMTGLLGDEASTGNICEVYNIWTAIDRLKSNVKNCFHEEQIAETINGVKVTAEQVNAEINSVLKESAPQAIINSYQKIKGYQKADGGFAHSYYKGTSAHQGLKVSNGANVADVDATCIATTGLTREIYAVLGLTSYAVPLYTQSDWMRYVRILEGAEPVLKGEITGAINSFANATVPEDISVSGGKLTIVKVNDSNALKFEKVQGSKMIISRSDVNNVGSCIRFESEMRFTSPGQYQIDFCGDGVIYATVIVTVSDSKVNITSLDGETVYSVANVIGASLTLKLELSVPVAEDIDSRFDLFADGVYLGRLPILSSITNSKDVKTVEITQLQAGAVIFDNLVCVITGASTPASFDDIEAYYDASASFYSGGTKIVFTEQSASEATIATVTEGTNKFIRLNKIYGNGNVSQTQSFVHFVGESIVGNTVIFQARIRYDNTNNKNRLKLNLRSVGEAEVWKIELLGGSVIYNNGASNASESTWGIKEGEWFNLRVEITTDSEGDFRADTYINGILRHTDTSPTKSFATADTICDFGVIPEMGWIGTVDVDDIIFSRQGNVIIDEEDLPVTGDSSLNDIPLCETHSTEVVIEGKIDPTCETDGSYHEVVRCTVCLHDLERNIYIIPAIGHNVLANGTCTNCNESCVIEGEFTFDDFEPGAWVTNEVGNVLIGHNVQASATSTATVVSENGDKYFSFYKSACTGTQSDRQSWINIVKTLPTDGEEAVVFESEIRHFKKQNNSVYFRFYQNRPAVSGGGTVFGSGSDRNVIISVSGGKIYLNTDIYVGEEGTWFKLRFVLKGSSVGIYSSDESGEMIYRGTITRSAWSGLEKCNTVTLMNDSTTFHQTEFKSIYFGGTPTYVAK